jgi:hypothetical protein
MRDVRRLMRAALLALGLGLALCVAAAGPAAADDCSGPADCEQTGGYNGIIAVVGGIGAVAAAAAAAADATPEGEETDLAIVQVSESSFTVDPENPAQLTLTGWNAGDGGKLERVAMSLSIDVPPSCGLTVEPTDGTGEMTATLTFDESTFDPDNPQVMLTVHGSWDGKETTVDVTVDLAAGSKLRLWDGGGPQVPIQDFGEGDLRG